MVRMAPFCREIAREANWDAFKDDRIILRGLLCNMHDEEKVMVGRRYEDRTTLPPRSDGEDETSKTFFVQPHKYDDVSNLLTRPTTDI